MTILKLIFSALLIWFYSLSCKAQLTNEHVSDIKFTCIRSVIDSINSSYVFNSETKIIVNAQIFQMSYQYSNGYFATITDKALKFDSILSLKLMLTYTDTLDTYKFKFDTLTHVTEYLDFEMVGLRPSEPYPFKTKVLYISICPPVGGWETLYPDPFLVRLNGVDSLSYFRDIIIPVTTMYCDYKSNTVIENRYLFYYKINIKKEATIFKLSQIDNYFKNTHVR